MPPKFPIPHLWIPKTPTTFGNPKHLTRSRNRKESLSLYREILRTAKHFHWKDEHEQEFDHRELDGETEKDRHVENAVGVGTQNSTELRVVEVDQHGGDADRCDGTKNDGVEFFNAPDILQRVTHETDQAEGDVEKEQAQRAEERCGIEDPHSRKKKAGDDSPNLSLKDFSWIEFKQLAEAWVHDQQDVNENDEPCENAVHTGDGELAE